MSESCARSTRESTGIDRRRARIAARRRLVRAAAAYERLQRDRRARCCELTLFVKSLPNGVGIDPRGRGRRSGGVRRDSRMRVPAVVACAADREHDVAVLALEWLDCAAPMHATASVSAARSRRCTSLQPATADAATAGIATTCSARRCNAIAGASRARPQDGSTSTVATAWARCASGLRRAALRHSSRRSTRSSTCFPHFSPTDTYRGRASSTVTWQGNWGMLADGTPVIYDPAVSCSDAEAELAMRTLRRPAAWLLGRLSQAGRPARRVCAQARALSALPPAQPRAAVRRRICAPVRATGAWAGRAVNDMSSDTRRGFSSAAAAAAGAARPASTARSSSS